jgi:hypothetical protein
LRRQTVRGERLRRLVLWQEDKARDFPLLGELPELQALVKELLEPGPKDAKG